MATYIVQGTLKHDLVTYPHGAQFETDDAELAARLRFYGALKLPAETLPAEEIAAREAALRAEIEALRAQVADKSGESGETPASGASGASDASGEESAQ